MPPRFRPRIPFALRYHLARLLRFSNASITGRRGRGSRGTPHWWSRCGPFGQDAGVSAGQPEGAGSRRCAAFRRCGLVMRDPLTLIRTSACGGSCIIYRASSLSPPPSHSPSPPNPSLLHHLSLSTLYVVRFLSHITFYFHFLLVVIVFHHVRSPLCYISPPPSSPPPLAYRLPPPSSLRHPLRLVSAFYRARPRGHHAPLSTSPITI